MFVWLLLFVVGVIMVCMYECACVCVVCVFKCVCVVYCVDVCVMLDSQMCICYSGMNG